MRLKVNLKKALKIAALTILAVWIGVYVRIQFLEPSNDRDWVESESTLAYADINDTTVDIYNVRNFRFQSEEVYTAGYYDKTYVLASLKSVDYVVEPFSGTKGAAHVFVSFGFDGGEYLAISVEIRKERGETFSALAGMFRNYEIIYVIADERDVVDLRANVRKDPVRIYPINATQEQARKMFLSMLRRANHLVGNPEFYNTITNNCALNVIRHANEVVDEPIPYGYKIFFPALSGRLAYELELIDTDLAYADARTEFLINQRADEFRGSPDFSVRIRGQR